MSKDLGQVAELRFELQASLNGFTVSRPYGDSASYDFIIDDGRRLLRVQVKSSQYIDLKRPRRMKFQLSHGANKRSYKRGAVDLFALYSARSDVFYLIPARLLRSRLAVNISINGKYNRYKENWNF